MTEPPKRCPWCGHSSKQQTPQGEGYLCKRCRHVWPPSPSYPTTKEAR